MVLITNLINLNVLLARLVSHPQYIIVLVKNNDLQLIMTLQKYKVIKDSSKIHKLLIILIIIINSSEVLQQQDYIPQIISNTLTKQLINEYEDQSKNTIGILKQMANTVYAGDFILDDLENILNWITVRQGQMYFQISQPTQVATADQQIQDSKNGIDLLQFVGHDKKKLSINHIRDHLHKQNKIKQKNQQQIQASQYFQFSLYLLNPKYITQQALTIQFNVSSSIFGNTTLQLIDEVDKNGSGKQSCLIIGENQWECNNTAVKYTKYWKDSETDQYSGDIDYRIKINVNGETDQLKFDVNISFSKSRQKNDEFQEESNSINSESLEYQDYYHLSTKSLLKHKNYTIRVLLFCLWVSLIPVIEMICARPILQKLQNQGIGYRMSLGSVTFCLVYDLSRAVIYGIHVYETTNVYYRFFYILPTIIYGMLYFFFDNKMFIRTYMSKFTRRLNGNPPNMKKVILISCAIVIFSYEALVISQMFFTYYWWYTLIISLFIFVPQIVRNVRKGHGGDDNFMYSYVLGYLGIRYMLFFYDNACPQNWHKIKPDYLLTIILSILLITNIIILYFQSKISAYFFIPRIFMPKKYQYNYKIARNKIKNNEVQCCICLHNFFQKHQERIEEMENSQNSVMQNSQISGERSLILNNEEMLEQELIEDNKKIQQHVDINQVHVFRTPCNHIFHQSCLKSWIQVKMECPICRTALPPI